MSCPSDYTVQQLALLQQKGRKSETFFYFFAHTPRNSSVVRHVAEIQYVFHQSELLRHRDDEQMADVMSSYWGNFFSTGNPNRRSMGIYDLPQWDAYSGEKDNVLTIRSTSDTSTVSSLKADECAFYIPRIDKSIRSHFPPQ